MDLAQSKGSDEVVELAHEGAAIDAVDGSSLNGRAGISGEVGTSREVAEDSGSNKELKDDIKGQEKIEQENFSDELPEVDQGASYSSNNLVNQEVLETVVVIDPEYIGGDNGKLEAKGDQSGLSLVSMKAPNNGVSETSKNSCVINIKCSSRKGLCENSEGERICRICHLATGQPSDAAIDGTANSAKSADLIQLGCACKEELGIAHLHCAEAWFKLKGNRYLLPNISV